MIDIGSIEIFAAFFSLIFVVISWILAIFILNKYRRYKVRQLLLVGIAWIGIALPWTTDGISVILLFTLGQPLNKHLKVFIELVFLPIALVLWLIAFTDMRFRDKKPLIIIPFVVSGILFELFLFYALIFDFSLIGTYTPPLAIDYSIIVLIFLAVVLVSFILTGIFMGIESLKSDSEEINLKGKFLIAAFVSFLVATILELVLPLHPVGIIAIRIILISSAFEYYIGFTLPRFIKDIFIGNN